MGQAFLRGGSMIVVTAEDATVRCLMAETAPLVAEVSEMHQTSPVATAALGRALTAGALMTHMLGPGEKLTLQWDGRGPLGRIIVTSESDHSVRGYVTHPQIDLPLREDGKLDVGGAVGTDGYLYVMKDLGVGAPYVGSVPLTSGEIAEDLVTYFAQSEQTPSAVSLGVLVDPDLSIRAAGGFIVQAMPGAAQETLARLEANVSALPGVTAMLSSMSKEQIVDRVMSGLAHRTLAEYPIGFRCSCSEERLEAVLATLGAEDLEHLSASGKPTVVTCDFCRRVYEFSLDRVASILRAARADDASD